MPGLTLDRGGGVSFSYNGMYVNKVYIDGVDMLEDNYEPILNMKPEDVERIEIVENHEPVKILRGVQYSSDAAINVVLKESAKSKWGGTAKLGAGASPALYSGDLYALNTGGDLQTLVLLKTDNTGLNLSNGSGAFDGFYEYGSWDYLNMEPSMAPLDDKRVRFNHSTFFNLTNTLKLSKDYQLNTQLSYLADRLTADSYEDKTYYVDGGGSVNDIKAESAESKKNEVSLNVALLANTDRMYLKNTLNAVVRWRDVEKNITGTFPNTQNVKMTPFVIKNDFEYNKAHGKNVFSVNWNSAFLSKPEDLRVSKADGDFVQNIDTRDIFSEAYVAYKISANGLTVNLMGGGTLNMRDLGSSATAISEVTTADNDSQLSYFRTYFKPSATYITDKMQVMMELPFDLYSYWFTDHNNDANSSSKDKLFFSPSISMKYEANRRLSLIFEASTARYGINRDRFYAGTIMSDFRNINRGTLLYNEDGSSRIKGAFSYALSGKSLFLSGDVTREWNRSAFLDIMSFTPNYIISDYMLNPKTEENSNWYINGSISKGIEAFRGKIGVDVNFSSGKSAMVRNTALLPFSSRNLTVTPYINGRLFPWLNTIYKISYSTSSIKLEDSDRNSTKEYTQSLEMIFSPAQKFNFSLLGEHYYTELSETLSKDLVLVDFKAEYTLSNKWQLIGSVTNLLDQDTYNYTMVDSEDFTRTHASYKIRPRNLLLSLYYKF